MNIPKPNLFCTSSRAEAPDFGLAYLEQLGNPGGIL